MWRYIYLLAVRVQCIHPQLEPGSFHFPLFSFLKLLEFFGIRRPIRCLDSYREHSLYSQQRKYAGGPVVCFIHSNEIMQGDRGFALRLFFYMFALGSQGWFPGKRLPEWQQRRRQEGADPRTPL
jgi:hypothetical protein